MKRIGILLLISWAFFLPTALSLQPAEPVGTNNWSEYLRTNMQRWNPYEKTLGVNNAGSLVLNWSYATGGYIDSSPAVVGGVVYVGSFDGNVCALNATTGAKLWSFTTGNSVDSSPWRTA